METLRKVKRIEGLSKHSIFYSAIEYKGEIHAFGRKHYSERKIKHVKLDDDFNVINETGNEFRGEDPRCFLHSSKLYLQDNYHNDTHLIEYETQKSLKINISGKNFSFISHKGNLYFIHYLKPFALYKLDLNTGNVIRMEVENGQQTDYEYRGGTPAYKLNKTDYYGYGHRTYYENGVLKHDPFKWIISFKNYKPSITFEKVEKPREALNICDPTSVVNVKNKLYLLTAESERAWFEDQEYITNVYEIVKKPEIKQMKYVVCLTTIPPRVPAINSTLFSWFIQSIPVDKVVVSVPRQYQRFNNVVNTKQLEAFSSKVKVQQLDVDYGSATKFYGALKYFHSLPFEEREGLNIIICDDDLIYDREIVGSYLVNTPPNKKTVYTLFNVRYDIADIPHLQGADTFCLPNHFLESTKPEQFETFIQKAHKECFDLFFHDDYAVSYFINVICSYDIKPLPRNHISGMVYKENEDAQVLEMHRDTLCEYRQRNVIKYLNRLYSKNGK